MDYNRDLKIVRTKENTYPLPYKNNVIWIHHDKNNKPVAEVWDHGRWVPFSEAGSGSENIIIDTEMSDSSSNAIANKIVKKYIDDTTSKTNETIKDILDKLDIVAYVDVPELENDYIIQASEPHKEIVYTIEVGTTIHAIVGDSTIKWINGEAPVTQADHTYVVSVIGPLAVWGEFPKS